MHATAARALTRNPTVVWRFPSIVENARECLTSFSFDALARGEPFSNSWMNFLSQDNSPWAIRRWRFHDPSLRRFDTVPGVTDGQTDRRTDNSTVANTGFCVASHGVYWHPVKCWRILQISIKYMVSSKVIPSAITSSLFSIVYMPNERATGNDVTRTVRIKNTWFLTRPPCYKILVVIGIQRSWIQTSVRIQTDLDEIFWRCGAWPNDQSNRFRWRSGARYGSMVPESGSGSVFEVKRSNVKVDVTEMEPGQDLWPVTRPDPTRPDPISSLNDVKSETSWRHKDNQHVSK